MFSILRVLASLALLCTWSVFILAQDSPIRTLSKKWTSQEGEKDNPFLRGYDERMDSRLNNEKYGDYLLYSTCDHAQDSNFNSCNVTIRSWPFARVNSLAMCKNYKMSDPKQDIWQTIRLSKNTILFVVGPFWYMLRDGKYFEYTLNILNMKNCSNVANISFLLKVENKYDQPLFVTVFDDTFEIVDRNVTHCQGMASCKIMYDFNGTKVGDPKPFEIEKNANYFPVSRKSSYKGYYALLGKENKIYEVKHVDSSGKSRMLMTVPQEYDFRVIPYPNDMTVDLRNELGTICARHLNNSRELRCLQFDTQGIKLNVSIELPTNGKKIAVYNLAGGDVLIIFGLCDNFGEVLKPSGIELVKLCSEIQIQRIGANGHMFNPLIIDGFDETDLFKFYRYYTYITENDHNEFCFPSIGPLRPFDLSTVRGLYYKWCIPKEWTL